METCLLKKKKICSFDILNESGNKNYELETIWKIASQKNLLTCDECGEEVFFRSGNIKIPHFAHSSNSNVNYCSKRKFISTEEYVNNKKNIYNLLKQIPEITNIEVDFKNNVEFMTKYTNISIKIYLKKIEDYIQNSISDLNDGITFLYGNKKYLKDAMIKNKNIIYLDQKVVLNIEILKSLYLEYISSKSKSEYNETKNSINNLLIDEIPNVLERYMIPFEYYYTENNKTYDLYSFTCCLKISLNGYSNSYIGNSTNKKDAKILVDKIFSDKWYENLDFLFSNFELEDYSHDVLVDVVNKKNFLEAYINYVSEFPKFKISEILKSEILLEKYNLKNYSEIEIFTEKLSNVFLENNPILDKFLRLLFIGLDSLNEEYYEKCLEYRWNKNLKNILMGIHIMNSEILSMYKNLDNIYMVIENLLEEEEFSISKNILENLLKIESYLNNEFKLKCYEDLALIYEIQNLPMKTLENYNKILKMDPKNIYIIWKTAYINESQNNFQEALKIYDKLESLGEETYKEKGNIYLKLNNKLKAIENFEQATTLSKANKEFLMKQNFKEETLIQTFIITNIIGELYFLENINLNLEFQISSKILLGKLIPLSNGDKLNCKIIKNNKNEYSILEAKFLTNHIIKGIVKYINLENKIIYIQNLSNKLYYKYSFEKNEKQIENLKIENIISINGNSITKNGKS
ncbi:MAG: competence protein CoiA family protein [Cetobacterium sp.]